MAQMTTREKTRGEVTSRSDNGDVFKIVLDKVKAANNALIADGILPAGIDQSRVVVEPPRDPAHGDVATNDAMVLAKDAGRKPRELAEAVAERLRADDLVAKVDVAGPGFINLTLKPTAWASALRSAIQSGARLRPQPHWRRPARQC